MTKLRDTLETYVGNGSVPGAVGLVARGDRVEVQVVGSVDVEGSEPMARDSIFRLASITKPIVAAATMMLVEDGLIALDDPVEKWLPELASPSVVRTPASPVDDVVPAARPITVIDLLDFRAGYGFPDNFSLPAVELLLNDVQMFGRDPALVPAPDEWMAVLSRVPLLHQPGDAWLYNTCSDIQGVLIARVSGRSLPEFLADRLFEPLGMVDTGFAVPADKLDRFTSYYQIDPAGGLALADAPDGESSRPPVFPSGAGGLVGTVDDWHAFARMLLAEGTVDGRPLMSPDLVRKMRTDQITQSQRDASRLFLEGQGWGFGGSVDVADIDPWNVQGRYGWVGGTGTTAHITPSTNTTTILLSQVAMTGPTPTALMRDFWRSAVAGPEV
jgi:CubicO group peptidase (beta-lactamase class C family)